MALEHFFFGRNAGQPTWPVAQPLALAGPGLCPVPGLLSMGALQDPSPEAPPLGSWVLLARPPEHTHGPHGGDCIRLLLPTILGGLPDPRGCPRATKPQRGKQLVGHGSKQQSQERSASLKPGLGLPRPLTHMPGPLGTGLPGVTVAPGMPRWAFSAAKAGTVSSGIALRDEETEPRRASVAFPEQREDLRPRPPGLQRDTGLGGHSGGRAAPCAEA